METILKTAIAGAIVFAVSPTKLFAAEFKRMDLSACKTVGGYHGCTNVPPNVLFTEEEFQGLKKAKPLSSEEFDRAKKPFEK